MLEVDIPKEIFEYKQKFLFGLTVRQFISVVIALGICVPLFIFGNSIFGEDLTGWLVILIAAPVFAFGFLKINGMPFEKFAVLYIRQKIEPQKRKYEDLSAFWYCREEIIEIEIAHQIAKKRIEEGRVKNGKKSKQNAKRKGA